MISLHSAGHTLTVPVTVVVAGLVAVWLVLALIALAGVQPLIIAPVPLAGPSL